jgi:uncharacterized membrane protein YjfL (UPF0719 family)
MKSRLPLVAFIIAGPVCGLALGLLGTYMYSTFFWHDLYMAVFYGFLIMYCGVIIGLAVPGYIYCLKIRQKRSFPGAVGWSVLGLLFFLLIYITQNTLTFRFFPYYISSIILPVILPLAGAILGFIYGLKNKQENKNTLQHHADR